MPVSRFYCPRLPAPVEAARLSDVFVQLDAEQAHHARKVLRLRPNDLVELCDGRGRVGTGAIDLTGSEARVRLHGVRDEPPPRPAIDIAAALPKGPRLEDMVNQLSQVGADTLIPLRSARSVVDPRAGKFDRLGRIAVEAAKQCRRATLLEIEQMTDFADALARPADLRLLAAPDGDAGATIAEALTKAQRVLVLIGPEGGWTSEEISSAAAAGFVPWRLGPHVMRVETAAAAAVSVLRGMGERV